SSGGSPSGFSADDDSVNCFVNCSVGVDVRAEQENERNALIAKIIEIVESSDEAAKMLDEIEFKTTRRKNNVYSRS
ncbi:hypothetical protein ACT4US_25815, partial [Bacillus sp. HC-Mk]